MARDDGISASILVATHERPEFLRGLLESLANADEERRAGEILVVENGPRPRSRDVVEDLASAIPLRYAHVEDQGKSPALNRGLRLVDGELIIFFDDDVTVDPGTVSAYLEAALRYGEGHYFGGRVSPRYEGGKPPPDWLSDGLPLSSTGFDLGPNEQNHDRFLGANWAAFRDDLLAVGGFCSKLGPEGLIGEETELQMRLADRGCTGVFLPNARVFHFVPQRHLSVEWASRRRYRQELGRSIIEAPAEASAPAEGPRLAGVPRYLWRSLAEQYLRVVRDRFIRPRTRARVQAEMRLAKLKAEIRAARWPAPGDPPVEADERTNP